MKNNNEEYHINISIRAAGGNASKNSIRGSLNIPKDVLTDMGITKEDSAIILIYDSDAKEMVIKKAPKVDII